MTNETMPRVVDEYFDLMDGDNKLATVDLFAPDAQVIDNGTTYHGHEEITRWLRGEASECTTTSRRLSAERTDHTVVVVIRVEGNFPGGLVDLRIEFLLDSADRISELTITS